MMVRTQLYLPQYKQIVQLAQQEAKPMAEIVRSFIQEGLTNTNTKVDRSGKATLLALSKMKMTGGPKDLSQNLDQYLYQA